MKETTLEHVIESLKDTYCDGRFTKTFARPIGADCWEVLARCKNIGTIYHYSIEVLSKDALLAELLKITGIDKHEQTEENKITLQSVRDEISDGLFHRFRFVFNTIGMPLDDMSILKNLQNAKVSMISGEKMSIETKDNVKVLDEIDKALKDRKRVADPINEITLQDIYDKVKDSDISFTSFNFEGDLSAITTELKTLDFPYFSWRCSNYNLDITVHNREGFLNMMLSAIYGKASTKKTQQDPINPTHYNGTQTLDRMVAVFGVDAVISFCEINAFEYRMMAGKKDGNPIKQDIEKALWYEGKANELKRKNNDG